MLSLLEPHFSDVVRPLELAPPISLIDIRSSKDVSNDPFADAMQLDAVKGLTQCGTEKVLPGLLLYNQAGLRLFEQITYQPEYYLTNVEINLLKRYSADIANQVNDGSWIVELGGGALRKTAIILDELEAHHKRVDYFSLDVDRSELVRTLRELQGRYQYVRLHALWGTYDDGCKWLSSQTVCPSYSLLWLGSSIGNMTRTDAADMLQGFGSHMRACDSMIVAMDGRNRDPELIRRAYNDKTGISRQFALNTLHHLNHLFGKDVVDVGAFDYAPIYNENAGRNEAYLMCKETTTIVFPHHNEPVTLAEGDKIRFAYSHKYSDQDRKQLYVASRAQLVSEWTWGDDEYTLAMLAWA